MPALIERTQCRKEQVQMLSPSPNDILAGVRVLDLCGYLAGPLCSMMLAEFGADVIEVENPEGGDETRDWPPLIEDFSGYFASMNRSKRSLALDLKSSEGLAAIHELVRRSDVVMQSFTPGVAERLGLGYEALRQINPKIIYYSLSGFGETGPYRTKRGFDPIVQAMSGFMSVTGEKNGPPVKTMIPIADVSAGIFGFASVLGALFWRERSGEGQAIDMSMFDVMVSMLTVVGTRYLMTGKVPKRQGTENPQRVPSAALECGDGRYLQLSPNQRHWPKFCELLGHPEWAEDPRYATPNARVENGVELYGLLRAAMQTKPAAEWRKLFDENAIVCGPIQDLAEVFCDPQVIARNMVAEMDVPGVGRVPAINLPFRYSKGQVGIRMPPPRLGEHSEEILKEVGFDEGRIRRMVEQRVVHTAPAAVSR
jgi:glutaryl-CoA transferase